MSDNKDHIISNTTEVNTGLWGKLSGWKKTWFVLTVISAIAYAAFHGVFLLEQGRLDNGFLGPTMIWMAGSSVFAGTVYGGLMTLLIRFLLFLVRYVYTIIYYTVRLDFSFLKSTSYWLTTSLTVVAVVLLIAVASGGL